GTEQSEAAQQARAVISERYREQSVQAFLKAYREAASGLHHVWQQDDGEQAALALFSIEKAAYEIAYEASYRPEWLDVPLARPEEVRKPLTEDDDGYRQGARRTDGRSPGAGAYPRRAR